MYVGCGNKYLLMEFFSGLHSSKNRFPLLISYVKWCISIGTSTASLLLLGAGFTIKSFSIELFVLVNITLDECFNMVYGWKHEMSTYDVNNWCRFVEHVNYL